MAAQGRLHRGGFGKLGACLLRRRRRVIRARPLRARALVLRVGLVELSREVGNAARNAKFLEKLGLHLELRGFVFFALGGPVETRELGLGLLDRALERVEVANALFGRFRGTSGVAARPLRAFSSRGGAGLHSEEKRGDAH